MTFAKDGPDPLPCDGRGPRGGGEGLRRPVMVRVPPETLPRIDRAAQRLGLARSAFMLASTLERVERMEAQTGPHALPGPGMA